MSDEPELSLYPQCEVCWVKENSRWEPDGVSSEGKLVARLVSVGIPVDLTTGQINICCQCGEITVVGIYVEKYPYEIEYDLDPIDADPQDIT